MIGPESSRSASFDNSWIKKHTIPVVRNILDKKKLTFFLDALLTYDVKVSPENQIYKYNQMLTSKMPNCEQEVPQSDFHNNFGENKENVVKKSPIIRENLLVEARQQQTDLRLEKYISETWEKYRKRYEHLGEKNPFARDPPSPDFLLSKHVLSEENDQNLSDEEAEVKYEATYKDINTESPTHKSDRVMFVPSSNLNQSGSITEDQKEFCGTALENNIALDSVDPDLEPEAEELDYQSDSEADQILNNEDTYLPVEDETQLIDDASEEQIHDSKQSVENCREEVLTERPNEYDEINDLKSKENSTQTTVPDFRSLSTNEKNHSPRRFVRSSPDIKTQSSAFSQQEVGTKTFRKPIKKPQKQHSKNNTHEPLRPLVNPYFVSPLGNTPMIPLPNQMYPFIHPGVPFNYWMPKPPFNQFNMFPYPYAWQSFPFTPPYFQPFFQQSMAPANGIGLPFVGQNVTSPTPSTEGRLHTPSVEVSSGPGYRPANYRSPVESYGNDLGEFKSNYNQDRRVTRTLQSKFKKPEAFNSSHPGFHIHHYQNFHNGQRVPVNKSPNQFYKQDQKWVPETEINNNDTSSLPGRESSYIIDAPQNQTPNSNNQRFNQSALQSSELRIPVGTYPISPNQHWHHDQSFSRSNWTRYQQAPPYNSPPYNPYLQQRAMGQFQQNYELTNDHERATARPNNDLPTHRAHDQLSFPPSPYHSWYSETPQYAQGHPSSQ